MRIAIITLIGVLMCFGTVFGGTETYSNRISGAQITTSGTGPQLSVYDGKYYDMLTNPTTWYNNYNNLKISNKIVLGINPNVVQTNALSGNITFNVKYWYWNGTGFSTNTLTGLQLSVDYSTTETNVINEINSYTFATASRVEVTITGIDAAVDVNDVYLDAIVEVERNYIFSGSAPASTGVSVNGDFVEFQWSNLMGAEYYELEWVHVNDYVAANPSSVLAASSVAFDFYKNSTRVVIGASSYKIPNVFDRGYLIFRVRGVGLKGSLYDKRQEGSWSLAESGVASGITATTNYLYIASAYSPVAGNANVSKMNWNHQVSYSEDGKRIEDISYTDGMGRSHQSLMPNPIAEQVLVSNVYYGGMGDASLGDLTTPESTQSLHHIVNFNRAVGSTYYGAVHFDNQTDPDAECVYTATAFDQNYGAGKYYSVNNPDKDGPNTRIPDANGYPFAKVEYMKDQTGRIRSVGGVGEEFQIGNGHETTVYYDTPDQKDLDRLFGTEAGLKEHYQRKITIDANGQAYAEYFDMAGRLVASCLMGEAPANLEDLSNNVPIQETVIMNSGIGANEETATSIKLTQGFQAAADGDYTFDYTLVPTTYADAECLGSVCLDCVYKLSLSVIDVNCGDIKYENAVYINGGEYDALCNGTSPYELSVTVALQTGAYTLVKLLEIAPEATSEYWCTYVENNSCLPTYAEIFNALYEAEDFSDCENIVVTDEFNEGCSELLPLLLSDVSPGGQYGQYTVSGSTYSSSDPISVFNVSNSLPGGGDWKVPSGGYKDALGNPAKIEVSLVSPGVYFPAITGGSDVSSTPLANGNYTVSPQYLANLSDFIPLFEDNPSWAEALLPYHPEYCYWLFCADNTDSEEYSEEMSAIDNFDDACDGGYFAPGGVINSINSVGTFTSCITSPALDPAFQSGGWGASYATYVQNHMQNYITLYGVTMSMWDYAVMLTNCPNLTNSTDITNCIRNGYGKCGNNDQVWLTFRDLYKAMKDSLYAEAEDDYIQSCGGGVADNVGVSSPYTTSIPRFGHFIEGLSATVTSGSAAADAAVMCADLAAGFAEEWMGLLADCPAIASMTNTQRQNLEDDLAALCGYACTYEHPSVATTLPPTLTTSPFVLPHGGNLYAGAGINEVLAIHILGFTESDLCTELLISSPAPYSVNVTQTATLDECGCDLLLELNQEYTALKTAGNLPFGVVSIEDYLQHEEGFTLEDIDYLICHCSNVTNEIWSSPYTWPTGQIEELEELAIAVPDELSCKVCIDCEALTAADSYLEGIFGGSFSTSPNYALIFTNYMNDKYDFSFGFAKYERFRNQCSGTSENPYCEATPELLNFRDVISLLARRGQLGPDAHVDLLADNIVYKKGALYEHLGANQYQSSQTGSTLTLSFYNDLELLDCATSLTIAEGAGFDFSDIIGFTTIQPLTTNCGENNTFKVGVQYIKCGEIAYGELTGSTDCFQVSQCYCNAEGLTLCDGSMTDDLLAGQAPCYEPELSQMILNATQNYETAMENAYTEFVANYTDKCNNAFPSEVIERTGTFNQYQYTLYFYDQAGNLVKTVAPKGVTPLTGTALDNVVTNRNGTTGIDDQDPAILPSHTYVTEHKYNSYGNVTESKNPDYTGTNSATKFWYDRYGRTVASQNPAQAVSNLYTYILFDQLGRRKESGIVTKSTAPAELDLKANDLGAAFENWVKYTSSATTTRTEVIFTYYDKSVSTFATKFKDGQQNLRLRVASVLQVPTCTNSTSVFSDYESAIHYSYDVHGNVIEVLQDVPALAPVKQDVKSTRYEVELISGNIKKVHYQREEKNVSTWEAGRDRMTHEYKYDKLNRLTEVFTTTDDGVHKSREARYLYFDYGPLARAEIGQFKVQGNDYSYTLQGWLKGMNSNTLNKEFDPGSDGGNGYLAANQSAHNFFCRDVVGYTLGYFKGDYKGIGNPEFESEITSGSALHTAIKDLFNGNIGHTVTAIEGYSTQAGVYSYDQLQRLKSATLYEGSNVQAMNKWLGSAAIPAYASTYDYDANGNLSHLTRKGNLSTNSYAMDDFTYQYSSGMNRLNYVTDAAGTSDGLYTDDINSSPTQISGNYVYDNIGQLTQDVQEGMKLTWKAGNNKLASQEDVSTHLDYIYNPMGQRVLKIKKTMTGSSPTPQSAGYSWEYTYYAYDANGDVMTTYSVTMNSAAGIQLAKIDEQSIFGAERLGLIQADRTIYNNAYTVLDGPKYSNKVGLKNYELTNHLGNVNAVITDRRVLDPDYSSVTYNYDFASSTPAWTTASGTPTTSVSSGNLIFGTATASAATVYRAETMASNRTVTFSMDVVDRSSVSNLQIEVYYNSSATLTGATLVKNFASSELVNGTTVTYTFLLPSGNTNVLCKLLKNSTEAATVRLDNLKLLQHKSRYKAVIAAKADYYPFGMVMPGRSSNNGNYRYGYNGMEQDVELKGNGNSYTTEFRQNDPRLGRWMSLDPAMSSFPWQSPYCSMDNNPIMNNDPFGDSVRYEKFRDKINVLLCRMFSKEFRAAHEKRKNERDVYTYRKRDNEPVLLGPRLRRDQTKQEIIDAGKMERRREYGVNSVLYDGLGIKLKMPECKIGRLAFHIGKIVVGIIKLPVGLFTGISFGIWNVLTFWDKDLHMGWGMNIRVSTVETDMALFGYGFGNYNEYNMFGLKRKTWAHSAEKIGPNDGHDGIFGIRFGVGKKKPVNFIDIGQQYWSRKTNREYFFHINLVGKKSRRKKLSGETVIDFVN